MWSEYQSVCFSLSNSRYSNRNCAVIVCCVCFIQLMKGEAAKWTPRGKIHPVSLSDQGHLACTETKREGAVCVCVWKCVCTGVCMCVCVRGSLHDDVNAVCAWQDDTPLLQRPRGWLTSGVLWLLLNRKEGVDWHCIYPSHTTHTTHHTHTNRKEVGVFGPD